jgi:predicted transcriptional regulator of viral defense system
MATFAELNATLDGKGLRPIDQVALRELARRRSPVWATDQALPGIPLVRQRDVAFRLQERGYLERIERGTYRIVPLTGVRAIAPVELVGAWFAEEPHAVIGAAAAEYHGLILDSPTIFEIQLARIKREVRFQGILYRFTRAKQKAVLADNVAVTQDRSITRIATPGKLMVLLLAQGRRGPQAHNDARLAYEVFLRGIELKKWDHVNWPLLVRRHGNAAVVRRLGYLLERHGIAGAEGLAALRGTAPRTNFSSAYGSTGPISRRWRLRLNDPNLWDASE